MIIRSFLININGVSRVIFSMLKKDDINQYSDIIKNMAGSKKVKKAENEIKEHKFKLITKLGMLFIIFSIILFLITFYPVIKNELVFLFFEDIAYENIVTELPTGDPNENKKYIVVEDKDYGIVIPKIGANTSIIPDVDPYNSSIYQTALTKGVAHALGTSYPDQEGNIFIFSHSSVNFYEASRFNSVFYLLHKLEAGDNIYIAYKGELFKYIVSSKEIVDQENVEYLTQVTKQKKVTLMTCWPPGTTYKRLIIEAELTEDL